MPGNFITIEGIEGAGKTTQQRLLVEYLEGEKMAPLATREPGDTEIGSRIRELLLDPKNSSMTARAEILLYAADRAQHVSEVIRPALDKGRTVVSDRYYDSNIAYQGYGRRLDIDMVRDINYWAVSGCHPDLTILLDISPVLGLKRARALAGDDLGDRLEREEISFHRRVRAGYLRLARTYDRFYVIDAEQSAEAIQRRIRKVVKERLL